MSQSLKCPNPICTHEFSAAELTGVASASCPRCGMVVQLRSTSAPAVPSSAAPTIALPPKPPKPVPLAQAVSAIPLAQPVTRVQPIAPANLPPPRPAPPTPTIADVSPPIVRARHRPRSRDWITYPLVIGGFLLLCAVGVVGFLVTQRSGLGTASHSGGYRSSDNNYFLNLENPKWAESAETKSKLGVNQLALRHAAPSGYFALDVIDFHDHNPTPRELDDEARKKLKAFFPKNVETNPPQDAPPQTADRVAGQTTFHIVFEGESNEEASSGEVVFFANQGLGYWLYTWAPTASAPELAADFKELRKSFSLLGERAAWKQRQQQKQEFEGDKIKGYRLIDTTGHWRKDDDPTAHDPKADLVLRAVDPAKPNQPTLGADLVVMSLSAGNDPVEVATEHVLKKHVREGYPETKIDDAYVGGEGPKDHVGDAKGRLLEWRINNGPGRERFAVVGIIPRAEDTLVLYGECDMARRFNWETQLRQLIESIQLK
jgi:hypothetical protein